jgi:hypothetical protein
MPGGDDEEGLLSGAEAAIYYFVEAAYEEADAEDLEMAIAALASAAVPETFAAAAVLDIDTSAAGGDPNAAGAGQTFNELDDYWQAASAAEQSQWLASNDQTSAASARERGEIPVFTPSNSVYNTNHSGTRPESRSGIEQRNSGSRGTLRSRPCPTTRGHQRCAGRD